MGCLVVVIVGVYMCLFILYVSALTGRIYLDKRGSNITLLLKHPDSS